MATAPELARWDDLRIFLAVLRAGSFSGAAEALGVEQSTISRRIAQLESELGHALFDRTLEGWDQLRDGGLLFANFVDFDTVYGHRRDVIGYAAALEAFDRRLPELLSRLKPDDLLVITADHGCDPTWPGTDHTREQVPILVAHEKEMPAIGRRSGFADIGATVARHLELPPLMHGLPF